MNFYRPPPLYQALFQTFPDTSSLFTTAPESDAGEATLCSDRIRFEYGDPESEVRACAEWARDLLADDPECHVGIIANLDEQRLARCRALIGQVLQPRSLLFQTDEATGFNHGSSSGSLLDHALVHDAFLLLNLANEQQLSEDVSRLLRSPFLLAAETEQEARLQMELYMRRYFTDRCTVQDLLYFLNREDRAYHCPQLAAALLAFRTRLRSQPGSQSASAWADCFALFGWDEPFATVYLEAMAAKTPILCCSDGGICDVVKHGIHGLIVPPRDMPAAAAALDQALNAPADLRLMGENGHALVSQSLTWDIHTDRLVGMLRKI